MRGSVWPDQTLSESIFRMVNSTSYGDGDPLKHSLHHKKCVHGNNFISSLSLRVWDIMMQLCRGRWDIFAQRNEKGHMKV